MVIQMTHLFHQLLLIEVIAMKLTHLSYLDFSVDLPLSDLFTIDTVGGDYELKTNFAIINLFDEDAPRLYDAPDFSFDTRVHDPRGRMLSIQFELAKK